MARGTTRPYCASPSISYQAPQSLTIEQHLANKDPYRVSPPSTIPIPWPFMKDETISPELSQLELAIQKPCHGICSRHSISIDSVTIEALHRKDQWPRIVSPTLMISTSDEETCSWKAAAIELHDLVSKDSWFLLSNGNTLSVELRNPSKIGASDHQRSARR
ncbi:uncharacterized protein RAG0_09022 [Rhynchosporium agropyri]|uniref:Uncharacterized protein n=1 Tax=Rhynchosporium agropyri TaxID=914238 RepID=A0A1E1KTE2_9HELO|nr:uncharacterized protein RAG0_09022 [Rhynchosporium agropyri]